MAVLNKDSCPGPLLCVSTSDWSLCKNLISQKISFEIISLDTLMHHQNIFRSLIWLVCGTTFLIPCVVNMSGRKAFWIKTKQHPIRAMPIYVFWTNSNNDNNKKKSTIKRLTVTKNWDYCQFSTLVNYRPYEKKMYIGLFSSMGEKWNTVDIYNV